MIRENAGKYGVEKMCTLFDISRSNYYDWQKRDQKKTKRQQEDESITQKMLEIHADHRSIYGVPKMHRLLKVANFHCGKRRIERLMKAANLYKKRPKQYRKTTQSNHQYPIAPNLLNRKFKTFRPNQVWVTDITYIPTMTGWLYLVVFLDLYSRKVVGWSVSTRLKTEFVTAALKKAIRARQPAKGLMIHSDRGVQYASNEYRELLAEHDIICSMSRKANCWDNAPAESFFSLLKRELLGDMGAFSSQSHAELAIFDYLECFYNRKRIHSFLNYQSPDTYEKLQFVA